MSAFAAAFPSLFHVTRRSAVAGIRAHGLRPAAHFAWAGSERGGACPNREAWTEARDEDDGAVWLRWQRLRDPVLLRRLPAAITPDAWRAFINSMVFLFPSLDAAEGLRGFGIDRAIDQVILRFSTDALLASGCALQTCRWNNGFPDRTKPPRIRSFADYVPASDWRRGDGCKEITVSGGILPVVPFDVL